MKEGVKRIAQILAGVKPEIAVILPENGYWTDHSNIARAAKDGILEPIRLVISGLTSSSTSPMSLTASTAG